MNTKETKKNTTQTGLNNWVVYRHIRLDKNMPFYIGIASDSKRPNNKKDRSSFWKSIVNKTDYIVEIIFENLTKDQAIEKEVEFIKLYGMFGSFRCGRPGAGIATSKTLVGPMRRRS